MVEVFDMKYQKRVLEEKVMYKIKIRNIRRSRSKGYLEGVWSHGEEG